MNKIKIRFITDFIDENIIIIKKRKTEIEQQLVDNNYPKIDDSYDYLLKMPIYTLSLDKIDELNEKTASLEDQFATINKKSRETLWEEDLESIKFDQAKTEKKKFAIKKKAK